MTDYNNGQIHGWNGGECPVHPETEVRYWLRNDVPYTAPAGPRHWGHDGRGHDIIAFQVVKQHVEPKVIWVNEYADATVAFNTERSARNYAMPSATRIAVKYVEAKDD